MGRTKQVMRGILAMSVGAAVFVASNFQDSVAISTIGNGVSVALFSVGLYLYISELVHNIRKKQNE